MSKEEIGQYSNGLSEEDAKANIESHLRHAHNQEAIPPTTEPKREFIFVDAAVLMVVDGKGRLALVAIFIMAMTAVLKTGSAWGLLFAVDAIIAAYLADLMFMWKQQKRSFYTAVACFALASVSIVSSFLALQPK